MILVQVRNEHQAGIDQDLVSLLMTIEIVQLVVGALSAIKNTVRSSMQLEQNSADVPVLHGTTGRST